MQKVSYRHMMLIIGPPLLLLLMGIAIYILVVKIITPESKVITALPELQSSESATPQPSSTPSEINPISMNVEKPSAEEIAQIQSEADNGVDTWRYDVMQTARRVAGEYGFIPGDQLTLILESENENPSGSASVIAVHGSKSYILSLVQPEVQGENGVWVLDGIEER